jgi:hypothetical protein
VDKTNDSAGPTEAEPIDPATLAAQCEGLMPFAKKGQFYGPPNAMGLGSGVIVASVAQPVFLPDDDAYGTGRGAALILTHECDIDPNNIRQFNDKALVAPLIRLDKYVETATGGYTPQEIRAFATNVAKGNTTRLCFLPRYGDDKSPLRFGAFIDLNYLTSCGIQSLVKSPVLCSLSGYAIGIIDRALQNHLFRTKVDRAPLPH